MENIEVDNEQYFAFTRMTPRLFECLLNLVGPHLQKDSTKRPLAPAHRLMMTLHYLAEGCSMHEIARNFRIGKATAHCVIKETSRRTIENTFGILVQRWRILRTNIIAKVENCKKFVMATIVLHNFLQKCEADIPLAERRYCPTGYADHLDENGTLRAGQWRNLPENLPSVGRLGSNNPKKNVQKMRDNLAEYLVSKEGCVPWQWDYIMKGSLPE
ncbi:hypothetical protein NQ314_001940 [Rhamnusium bicolor]|uniref:Transposase n=1 Tax=Rhamnusium bicolor TaxID=1586634 RepID=A0AAV8ZSJ2_9CUCU|nr:hypothetical protein NQ314_001940 [Rhamnusium bicolor]